MDRANKPGIYLTIMKGKGGYEVDRKKFKAIRLDKRMTQDEFGHLLGLAGSSIANIEAGRRGISDSTIARLARVDISADFLSFFYRMQEVEQTLSIKT